MTDFRKRNLKEAQINAENIQKQINQLFQLILELSGRYFKFERNVNKMLSKMCLYADQAEWRSLAIMKLLDQCTKMNIPQFPSEEQIVQLAEQLKIEEFNKESDDEDIARGMQIADEDIAEKGYSAIFSIKFFNKGEELIQERKPRCRVNVGDYELFPELDDVLKGMKVGEVKVFPLGLQGQTDMAEICLLGLRKPKPQEEKPTEHPESAQDPTPA
jgi:hypothetical protein